MATETIEKEKVTKRESKVKDLEKKETVEAAVESVETKKPKKERIGLPVEGRMRIIQSKAKDLEFEGSLWAEVESFHGDELKKTRYTRLSVYRVTGKNVFVAVVTHLSKFQHVQPRYEAAVCTEDEDVVKFFGLGYLAKKLYKKLNIAEARGTLSKLN